MKNRTADIHIRLTKEEAEDLKQKAKMCRITQSALIRILLKGYEPRQAPDNRFYQAMNQLSAIGSSINQLAEKANLMGLVDGIEYKQQAEKLWKLQSEIEKEFISPNESKIKF